MPRLLFAALAVICGFTALAVPAQAHRASDAYLSLTLEGSRIEGRWDIALRDLERALGLDTDRDGSVTWGELRGRHADIAAYALARLSLAQSGSACPMEAREHLVEKRDDGSYAVLRFEAACASPVADLALTYDLLFDLDRLHRGLLQIRQGDRVETAVLAPDNRTWSFAAKPASPWRQAVTYLREGIWHIWIGFDHILFLVSLLLPAVLRRDRRAWEPRERLRPVFLEVAKVVTAFTLAHSVTLGLTTLGWLDWPSRIVEPVIAATIVLAALNNIVPLVTRGLWLVAFGFGLVHGVGFAGALGDLGLPDGALLTALLSFNLGVELGQLVIVGLLLPLTFAGRHSPLYPRLVLQGGSLAVAAVAGLWLVERSFGLALIS